MDLLLAGISRDDLLERVGDISQVAGLRRVVLSEGRAAGLEVVEVRTGTGLQFEILVGRGMDIGVAHYRGTPLSWCSPTGDVAAPYFEPRGFGWLRSFAGGLLVGCGLRHVGPPAPDDLNENGLHGRVSNTPAEHVGVWAEWEGERYVMRVRGTVREAGFFGPYLELTRTITAWLGESSIHVEDVVTNRGFEPTPHRYLYHMNFGFPIVDRASRFVGPVLATYPRDAAAAAGLASFREFPAPEGQYQEQVFYHEFRTDDSGTVHCGIVRDSPTPIGVALAWQKDQFPQFVQWKMHQRGTYLVGLEPANCRLGPEEFERNEGRLVVLGPGESRHYSLTISVVSNEQDLRQLTARIAACVGD